MSSVAYPPLQLRCQQIEKQLRQLSLESFAFPRLGSERLIGNADCCQTSVTSLEQLQLWLPLLGTGTEVIPSPLNPQTYWLKLASPTAPLLPYGDAHGYVSSAEILLGLSKGLTSFPGVQAIKLNSNRTALFVQLQDDSESFQLIPTISVNNPEGQRIYSLVPNGRGNWVVSSRLMLSHR
ncbi:MAG: hypothetical protein SAJ72_24675 [Jaaginema sp. PMC 1080.18]|nr:hypothetical protein [Jaaginema sp. PMC 1080.18]